MASNLLEPKTSRWRDPISQPKEGFMADQELLTGKKIAEKIGVPAKKVNDFLKANNISPDKTKGACKYYGPSTVKKIEKALK